MVNYVVALIDSINRELATENARYQRKFIEKRYADAQADLKVAEERLNEFQKLTVWVKCVSKLKQVWKPLHRLKP